MSFDGPLDARLDNAERLDVEAVTVPYINHAMAHLGSPFVTAVTVTRRTGHPPGSTEPLGVELELVLRDATGARLNLPFRIEMPALETGRPWTPEVTRARLDAPALAALETSTSADLQILVRAAGPGSARQDPPAEQHVPLRALAARHWVFDPQAQLRSLEHLAVFVQPNNPRVAELAGSVGDDLLRRTGRASLAVTEVTPERIDEVVESIFRVVHDLGISYAEPPASWGYGQVVRSPAEVLDGRVGTCLDTTLTLAAIMEHLGIGTQIWLVPGHAFLGYWRGSGMALPDVVSLQAGSAMNAVDLGLIGLLETTMLTRERRPPRDLVRRARQAPVDTWIRGGSHRIIGVVDLALARLSGLIPLPTRSSRADGTVEVVEYHAAETVSAAPLIDHGTATPAARRPGVEVPPRVQAWKNSLLDLTLRNPLLSMTSRITQLPLVVPHGELGTLTDLLQDGGALTVRPEDDRPIPTRNPDSAAVLPGDLERNLLTARSTVFSELDSEEHRKRLTRLRYRARSGLQETGANLLTLTLGRIDWQLGDRELSAPLFLLPVQLKGVIAPYKVVADPAGQVTLNLSLAEKLRHELGFEIPQLAGGDGLPMRTDGEGVDVRAALRSVREAIAASGLPLRVDDEARLAIIAFTGYLLWRDLDEHWQTFLDAPLLRHLALTPNQPYPSEKSDRSDSLDAITAASPLPIDGSQAEAIGAARDGRSFVLEGPPGTGKSQTIAAMLADQTALGRTVLFVAEKGAALDVVRNRLQELGLGELILDLHDDAATPTEVRGQLKRALTLRPAPDRDAYRTAADDTAASASALSGYARRLHEPNSAGLSLYAARSLQLTRGEGPRLDVPADAPGVREAVAAAVPALSALGRNTWQQWGFATRFPEIGEAGGPAGAAPAQRPWQLTGDESAALDDLVRARGHGVSGAVFSAARTPADLAGVARLMTEGAADPHVLREIGSARWQQAHDELAARTSSLAEATATELGEFDTQVFGVDEPVINQVRQAVREAESSFFVGRRKRLLAAAAPLLERLRPGVDLDPKRLPYLTEQVTHRAQQARDLGASWRALPGCAALPVSFNPLLPEAAEQLRVTLATLSSDAATLATLSAPAAQALTRARASEPPLPSDRTATARVVAAGLARICDALAAFPADVQRWADSLTPGDGLLAAWTASAAERDADRTGAGLRRWAETAATLAPLREHAEAAAWQLLTLGVDPAQAVAAVDRGLAAASVAERLQQQGFADFDGELQDRLVSRFQQAGEDLRHSLREVLPATVVEQRPFGAMSGAIGAIGAVAALEREVNRSRRGMSVRRLIETFGSVIGEVTPCVLVSPDSLARFLPPAAMTFDLVVFDEASQITVADAVGALGRARAAVIAGDSKQLPPSRFGGSGAGDETDAVEPNEFLLPQDEESILSEAVAAGVPRLWLSWHYRSRHESLIAFSNNHYYDGRLLTFPAVPGGGRDAGISLRRVPGTFIRRAGNEGALRTNPVEAAAVVEEVVRRWREGERSLGVVTFNIQQRALIEELIAATGDPELLLALEDRRGGIFVKNLENVQGDERDVVLFSTGFAADAKGVLPLNFGPLNRLGGERRLNVAVTRARHRVIVFSSFDPADLRAEQTSSTGIKHLRAYLDLAAAMSDPRESTHDPYEGAGSPAEPHIHLPDRHRDQIAERLRSRGLGVRTSLGASDFQVDLAVTPADQPAGAAPTLAVLLDGPRWAGRRSTTDRDALPVTVLRDVMGWPDVLRIWLPAWLAEPDRVIDDVVKAAQSAGTTVRHERESLHLRSSHTVPAGSSAAPAQPDTVTEPASGAPSAEAPPTETPATRTPPTRTPATEPPADPASDDETTLAPPPPTGIATTWHDPRDLTEPYIEFAPTVVGGSSRLNCLTTGRPTPHVLNLIHGIVATEGPLSPTRLTRHLLACHGITRVQGARVHDVIACLPPDLVRDDAGFIWPRERNPLAWNGYRVPSPGTKRPLEEIPPRELANALTDLTRAAIGIEQEELYRHTVKLFGGTRVTDTARTPLDGALRQAATEGRLSVVSGVVHAPR